MNIPSARELANCVNSHDSPQGLTPLHYAAYALNEDNIRRLIEKGAIVDAETIHGVTPLGMFVSRGDAGLESV